MSTTCRWGVGVGWGWACCHHGRSLERSLERVGIGGPVRAAAGRPAHAEELQQGVGEGPHGNSPVPAAPLQVVLTTIEPRRRPELQFDAYEYTVQSHKYNAGEPGGWGRGRCVCV